MKHTKKYSREQSNTVKSQLLLMNKKWNIVEHKLARMVVAYL
jgi:hypothetical protein